jgi:hypothetical protein
MFHTQGRLCRPYAAVLVSAGLIALGWPGSTAGAQLAFEYAEEPDTLVIQLSQNVGIVDADQTPLLRVYGDGLARIHFPVYMKRAGDYTLQLNPSELQELVASFVDGGLIDFSPEATRAQMRGLAAASRAQAPARQPRQLITRSDETTVSIEINLDRYVPPFGRARDDVTAHITWTGAQGDAADFATLDTLQALAAAERRLLALTARDDATRIPD